MGVTHSIEWNEVMRTEIQKYTLRLIIAVLACIGLMSAAHATPLNSSEPTVAEEVIIDKRAVTSGAMLDYLMPARHRCYQRRYARSRYCCGWDFYGGCRKWCVDYAYRDYCPRHKTYRKRYRKPRYY